MKIRGASQLDYSFLLKKKETRKKDEFHCFCYCNPTISHRMLDYFMNEIIDEILQFWEFFYLSQNVSHPDLFKLVSPEKHEVVVPKRNGYDR